MRLASDTEDAMEATMSQPPPKPRKPGLLPSRKGPAAASLPASEGKNLAAQILGQMGGLKRAATMSPERRSEIARQAAKRRWSKGQSD
jgi:hypothetical protein